MHGLRSPRGDVFTAADADRLTAVLKAVAHPVRLKILHLLRNGEVPFAQICEQLPYVAQSTISYSVKRLSGAGLIETTKPARFGARPTMCRLVDGALAGLGDVIAGAGS